MAELTIPESHHDLLRASTVALSTLNDDGTIQTTAVWVLLGDDGVVRMSLAKNRAKHHNLTARPQATLFAISPTNPFHVLEIRATVEFSPDADLAFFTRAIAQYGQTPETMPEQAAEEREVVTFRPTRVRAA